jgi:aspartyl-tRNA(Asn)/glutamyl-tRNA(Gln) amidotransferase subunit A
MSIRFGISHDGMLISVQVMLIWQAEQTVHAASLLEAVSSVRDLHPVI